MLTVPVNSQTIFNFSNKGIFKDFFQLFLLFGLAIYFVYYAPSILNKVFFSTTLVLFYKSKKDYFWVAFVFLLMMAPGTLFRIVEGTDHNIPKIGIGSGLELGYFGFFILIAFMKALYKKGKKMNSLFKTQYKFLLIYLVFLNVISLFYGFNLSFFIVYLKTFLTYTLFFSLPILIPKSEYWFKFAILFSPFVILVFISQLYNIFQGHLMVYFFLGNSASITEINGRVVDGSVDIRPTGLYAELLYLALFSGAVTMPIFLIFVKEIKISKTKSLKSHYLFKELKSNDCLHKLLVPWFLNCLANAFPMILFVFFVTSILNGTEADKEFILFLYFLSALIGMAFWVYLIKYIEKKDIWRLSMAISSLVFILVFFLETGNIFYFSIISCLTGFCLGADLAIPPSMLSDVTDYHKKNLKMIYQEYYSQY